MMCAEPLEPTIRPVELADLQARYIEPAPVLYPDPPECSLGVSIDRERELIITNLGFLVVAESLTARSDQHRQAWVICPAKKCKNNFTAVEIGPLAVTRAMERFDIHWDVEHLIGRTEEPPK